MILDWVPAHFPKDAHGARLLRRHASLRARRPALGEHRDWGTKIFNYGRPEVRNFLFGNALFWLERYHIDGLRVDAVASMLYLDYSRKAGRMDPEPLRRQREPGGDRLPAAASTTLPREHPRRASRSPRSRPPGPACRGRPTRRARLRLQVEHGLDARHARLLQADPVYRKYHHDELTFSMMYAYSENFMLPLSHDEVVHRKGSLLGKMPGDEWQQFANLRLLSAYMYAHPGKKLLFMGDELGQCRANGIMRAGWNGARWKTRRTARSAGSSRTSTAFYRSEPALFEADFKPVGFEWLEVDNADESIIAFLRKAKDPRDAVLFAANFSAVSRPTTASVSLIPSPTPYCSTATPGDMAASPPRPRRASSRAEEVPGMTATSPSASRSPRFRR